MGGKQRRIFRRYKAGYEVWIETSAVQWDAEIISDPEPDGSLEKLVSAIEQPRIVTMKTAYTPDGAYIGDSKWAHQLCKKRGIKPEALPGHKVCSIGFCAREQKWYGWSHRAIYGFGVGSEVERGDCAYTPTDREDFRLDSVRFWDDDGHDDTHAVEATEDGRLGVRTSWTHGQDIPNKKIRGKISGVFSPYPDDWGRGEWTAKSLDDAKQMAVDFAEGVA